jgi:hypothetical protein
VDFVVSLLTGKALDWATAIWTANSIELGSKAHFHTLFKEVFDHSPSGRPIGDLLIELQQGRNSAAEYALEFLNMAARSGWSEAALLTVYRRGISRELQSELACRGDLRDLNKCIRMSISIDHHIADRRRTLPPRNLKPSLSMILSSRPSLPEPMLLSSVSNVKGGSKKGSAYTVERKIIYSAIALFAPHREMRRVPLLPCR